MMQDPSFRGQRATAAIGVILSHAGDYTSPVRYFEKVTRSAAENQSSQALPPEAWMAAYPLAFWPEVKKQAATYGVDPYLILAIMREESRFDPAVTSRARARGLMQIIKRTGKNIARQLQLENYYTKKLYDPTLNIQMGTYYYSQVFNLFAGNHALALASYNGGPGAVTKWKKKLLDEKGELDIDEFIEHIPYKETKYYVKKVLNTYYEYKRIYGSKG
jgi:soluble lytic murein transglycosylase